MDRMATLPPSAPNPTEDTVFLDWLEAALQNGISISIGRNRDHQKIIVRFGLGTASEDLRSIANFDRDIGRIIFKKASLREAMRAAIQEFESHEVHNHESQK